MAGCGRCSRWLLDQEIGPVLSDIVENISSRPVRVFYSYASEDQPSQRALDRQLSVLVRAGLIETWHAQRISAGHVIEDEIAHHLQSADLVLLLVSSDYLGCDECYQQLQSSLARHHSRDAFVIPVLVRDALWKSSPIGNLWPLPPGSVPISRWQDEDYGWAVVAEGVRRVAEAFRYGPSHTPTHRSSRRLLAVLGRYLGLNRSTRSKALLAPIILHLADGASPSDFLRGDWLGCHRGQG